MKFEDIAEFEPSDSRSYKEVKEGAKFVLYRKVIEDVIFNDDTKGFYVYVLREVHSDSDFDSVQSETVIKQKVFTSKEENKANKYYLSDRK